MPSWGGIWDRAYAFGAGLAGAAHEVAATAGDVVTAPLNDDETFNGAPMGIAWRRGKKRLGRAVQYLLGEGPGADPRQDRPEDRSLGIAAATGGLPEAVRGPVRGTARAFETAGREAIREPLASAQLAQSIAASEADTGLAPTGVPGLSLPAEDVGGFLSELMQRDTWRTAYDMSQSTSVGQAFIARAAGVDVLDPAEMQRFVDSSYFHYASGTVDFMARMFAEPDILVAKAGMAGKAAVVGRRAQSASRAAEQVSKFFNKRSFARTANLLDRTLGSENTIAQRFRQRWVNTEFERFEDFQSRIRTEAEDRALQPHLDEINDQKSRIRSMLNEGAPEDEINDAMGRLDELEADQSWRTRARQEVEGRLREQFEFVGGERLAHALAHAGSQTERALVWRVFSGDQQGTRRLREINNALANKVERATMDANIMEVSQSFGRNPFKFGYLNRPERAEGLYDELADMEATLDWTRGMLDDAASLPSGPGFQRTTSRLRDRLKRSRWYQESEWARPLQVIFEMKPRAIDLNRTNADTNFVRFLEHAGSRLRLAGREGIEATEPLFSRAEIDEWRGRFNDPNNLKHEVIWEAEDEIYRRLADDVGMSQQDIRRTLANAQRMRQSTRQVSRGKRMYDAGERDLVYLEDSEETMALVQPLARSQSPDIIRPLRVDRMRKMLDDIGSFWDRNPGLRKAKQLPARMVNGLIYAWKPSVLARPAWAMRVVGLDESLRLGAMFSAMASIGNQSKGLARYAGRFAKDFTGAKAAGLGAGLGFLAGGASPFGLAMAAGGAGLAAGTRAAAQAIGPEHLRMIGMTVDDMPNPLGDSDKQVERMRRSLSARKEHEEFLNSWEQAHNTLTRDPDNWRSFKPRDPGYEQSWTRAINRQVREDPFLQQALDGKSPSAMASWLRRTKEGRAYRQQVSGFRGRQDPDTWAQQAHAMVNDLFAGDRDLMSDALERKVKPGDLGRIPDEMKPPVHGEHILQTKGQGAPAYLQAGVNDVMHALGTMPTDELSRSGMFKMVYEQEMRRRMRVAAQAGEDLTTARVNGMADRVRQKALEDVEFYLYQLGEESRLGEMVDTLIPFFPAFQEVGTRWASIAARRPDHAVRAGMAWTKVKQMAEEDDQGRLSMSFEIPEWARGLVSSMPGMEHALDSQGRAVFNPEQVNMVLGGIGFGPHVQWAASQLVHEVPEAEEMVKFILPYGPNDPGWQGVLDAFSPTTAKRALSRAMGDRSFQYSVARIMQTHLVRMDQGLEEKPQSTEEWDTLVERVRTEANQYFKLRQSVAQLSPLSLYFESPYQPYIDALRNLQESGEQTMVDPETGETVTLTPDDMFLRQFGDEFFALTESLSNNNSGLPATIEADQLKDTFGKWLRRSQDEDLGLGSWVLGAEASGANATRSYAVYLRQTQDETYPGSGEPIVEPKAPAEVYEGTEVSRGWREYIRAMDRIDFEREKNGYANLDVQEAQWLADAKQTIIQDIRERNPQWALAYDTNQDLTRTQRRIDFFRDFVQDERVQGRPEVQGLKTYLSLRDRVQQTLAEREAEGGASTLEAEANQDLRRGWDTAVTQLVADNPIFAQTWHRFLENDLPSAPDEGEE